MKELSTEIGQTMTTREIAELTGKLHKNVVRDFKKQCDDLEIEALNFGHLYTSANNQQQTEYCLDKEQTTILVSGYSTPLRAKVVRRWIELEAQQQVPQDFVQALQLAVDQQRIIRDQQQKIEHDEPLVELANATSAKGYITRREWVNLLKHQGCKIKERRLTEWLMANGYCYKDQLTGDTRGYAHFDHLLTVKLECINGYSRKLLVVTDAGVRELSAKVLRAHKEI